MAVSHSSSSRLMAGGHGQEGGRSGWASGVLTHRAHKSSRGSERNAGLNAAGPGYSSSGLEDPTQFHSLPNRILNAVGLTGYPPSDLFAPCAATSVECDS